MSTIMPSLTKAPNGDWFARKVIPADVRDAYQRAYGVRCEERFRLTAVKSAGEAKAAFAGWVALMEGRVAALRAAASGSPLDLSQRQIDELAGRWYDWFIRQCEAEAAHVAELDHLYERYETAVQSTADLVEDDGEGAERSAHHAARVRAFVLEASRLPTWLAGEGIRLSLDAHDRFVDTVENDLLAALSVLRRRAGGDYRPDTHRARFPQSTQTAASPLLQMPSAAKLTGWNSWDAFEARVKERQPQASTINRWRAVFDHLNKHVDGRDVALISDEDAVGWKDKLMSGAVSGRTVNEVWLTAARRVFNWVKDQKKISANPFDGVKVATSRAGGTKGEFRDEDAYAILAASLSPQSPRLSPSFRAAIRWVPWLCAYTGSRPGEITQLRKEDIEQHRAGFWMLHIRPEAGTVKGAVARTVVIHEHLIEQGFIAFVKGAPNGPLFYDPKSAGSRAKGDDPLNPPRPPYVQVRQKLGDWVRKLGITDKAVSPNHAWRHTFKRRAARAKIEQRLRDAFCGHSSGNVGSIYERPSVEDLADAIKEFPRYTTQAGAAEEPARDA